ncbi:MAG TPA: electron transfer flavoprotein subunit alpha/FixB family protein, partial [Usitatibacter sp.]|nr:electron transfer flavoprotein subunit alpha/FixB family protein [Usitatibacter sp.]
MASLVIAEHDNTHVRGGTANAVTAATKMGGEVHVLVAGQGAAAAAADAAKLAGVAKVLHAEG